jgi:hypothetical protein
MAKLRAEHVKFLTKIYKADTGGDDRRSQPRSAGAVAVTRRGCAIAERPLSLRSTIRVGRHFSPLFIDFSTSKPAHLAVPSSAPSGLTLSAFF